MKYKKNENWRKIISRSMTYFWFIYWFFFTPVVSFLYNPAGNVQFMISFCIIMFHVRINWKKFLQLINCFKILKMSETIFSMCFLKCFKVSVKNELEECVSSVFINFCFIYRYKQTRNEIPFERFLCIFWIFLNKEPRQTRLLWMMSH